MHSDKSGEFENSSWLAFFSLKLWYPMDGNAAAHSVDSVIFYAVIHLPARFKICILNVYSSKQCQIMVCYQNKI